MKYVRHNLLEIEAETGVAASTADVISMRWSNDKREYLVNTNH